MSTEIINAEQLGFISWANQHWVKPPKPLRRILSLMRMHKVETIILESREWQVCHDTHKDCWSTYSESCISCNDYIEKLAHYDCSLPKKKCFRLTFFNKKIEHLHELKHVTNDDYLGFCILHEDKFLVKNKGTKEISYVTESIIRTPFRKGRFSINGSVNYTQCIDGTSFSVNGNYFCQQNAVTNCCANAAIKMALRDSYPKLTAEKINSYRGADHITKKGNEGMVASEICDALEALVDVNSYLLNSDDLTTPDLLKLIYHAIESRLPVILLITISQDNPRFNANGVKGHAISIKGHSFNEHNWWSYGLGAYFQGKENLSYLPSSLWCDNFIIQDDNMGPYYLLPVKFLFGDFFHSKNKTMKEKILVSVKKLLRRKHDSTWLKNPFEVIIAYRDEMSFFKDQALQIEPWAIFVLNEIVEKESHILSGPPMVSYFTEYYKNKSLILRTYVIDKDSYLTHLENDTGLLDQIELKVYEEMLPKYFWITEISIPELFWINQKKVGELIINPNSFNGKDKHGVVYLRLMNNFIFFKDDKYSLFTQETVSKKKWLYKLASSNF